MALQVYNSLSRSKEEFAPLVEGEVSMYVCGVTPYDHAHMGHARAAVTFDVVRRFLEFKGYKVRFLTNFTDIDDKIIRRANEEHVGWKTIPEKYSFEYIEEMKRLNVLPPEKYAFATEHIPQIIQVVQTLIEKGYAYKAQGDVYFHVSRFKEYGELSNQDLEQLVAGARIEPGEVKENPEDFALWKASKPGEPSWESPFGRGRPGWHIECSAMIGSFFGPSIDIHGGGADLLFPHHENEIAQSECATGEPLAKYWMHNGLLQVGEEKMSKSLKNFLSLNDALASFEPDAIRLFFLTTHYRSPLKYGPESLAEAHAALTRLENSRANLAETIAEGFYGKETAVKVKEIEAEFLAAMEDDFNTSKALSHLFELARLCNSSAGKATEADSKALLASFERLGRVLGLFGGKTEKKPPEGVELAWIEGKLAERQGAREAKDYAASDAIRKELVEKGVAVADTPKGQRWHAA